MNTLEREELKEILFTRLKEQTRNEVEAAADDASEEDWNDDSNDDKEW